MSGKLRLGPLPKTESVRLTITLPAVVKGDLDRYAELYASEYGEPIDASALVPHMVATFMDRDRAFRRQVQAASSGGPNKASLATSAAISKTSDTADEASSLR